MNNYYKNIDAFRHQKNGKIWKDVNFQNCCLRVKYTGKRFTNHHFNNNKILNLLKLHTYRTHLLHKTSHLI